MTGGMTRIGIDPDEPVTLDCVQCPAARPAQRAVARDLHVDHEVLAMSRDHLNGRATASLAANGSRGHNRARLQFSLPEAEQTPSPDFG